MERRGAACRAQPHVPRHPAAGRLIGCCRSSGHPPLRAVTLCPPCSPLGRLCEGPRTERSHGHPQPGSGEGADEQGAQWGRGASPCSQCLPWNPRGHSHVYESSWASQEPPLKQGSESQGEGSAAGAKGALEQVSPPNRRLQGPCLPGHLDARQEPGPLKIHSAPA